MSLHPDFSAVVTDELPLVSESLAAFCLGIPGCRVLGHCYNGEEALRMIEMMRPDVALLDLNLPVLNIMEILRRIRESGVRTRSVVTAVRGDRQTVIEALRTGASAFVLKSGTGRHLEDAIHQVIMGAVYVSPQIELQRLVGPDPEPDPLRTLSSREFQVFSMLVDGIRAKDIAYKLSLSPKTVDTYRANLMRKLDLHDVPSLVKFAIQNKLTS